MNKFKYLHIIVPHRGVYAGKTRLNTVLDDAARSELNRWLLARTLRVVNRWLREPQRVTVVSPCSSTLALAKHAGASACAEPAPALGLNAALVHGAGNAVAAGARQLLILPCDLPCLDADALDAMLKLADAGGEVIVAPDRHATGTNAMLVPASGSQFAFGVGSLARHIAMADARGMSVRLCKSPALAFDLDTETDFSRWLASGADLPPFLAARHAA